MSSTARPVYIHFQTSFSLTLHCHLHPLQAANCCRNSRLVVNEDDLMWFKNCKKLPCISKPLGCKKIQSVFMDVKWCFNASWGLKGLISVLPEPYTVSTCFISIEIYTVSTCFISIEIYTVSTCFISIEIYTVSTCFISIEISLNLIKWFLVDAQLI